MKIEEMHQIMQARYLAEQKELEAERSLEEAERKRKLKGLVRSLVKEIRKSVESIPDEKLYATYVAIQKEMRKDKYSIDKDRTEVLKLGFNLDKVEPTVETCSCELTVLIFNNLSGEREHLCSRKINGINFKTVYVKACKLSEFIKETYKYPRFRFNMCFSVTRNIVSISFFSTQFICPVLEEEEAEKTFNELYFDMTEKFTNAPIIKEGELGSESFLIEL